MRITLSGTEEVQILVNLGLKSELFAVVINDAEKARIVLVVSELDSVAISGIDVNNILPIVELHAEAEVARFFIEVNGLEARAVTGTNITNDLSSLALVVVILPIIFRAVDKSDLEDFTFMLQDFSVSGAPDITFLWQKVLDACDLFNF